MSQTLTYKILQQHLVEGKLQPGEPIGIRIDQTLTQDATGTTVFLLFESMGLARVRTELSVSYVDHNMAQFGPENHNDHLYLQSIARKVGVYHSRPGNGICHQVHLERFGRPGATLLGSDSHTPTCGGLGMLAIGAGGLDVASAMGGGAFYLTCPKVIGVHLTGRLHDWVSSKDIILTLLSILSTKGNVDCVIEYFGPGVQTLTVPQRATVTNMGAELGVTTSIFPSDEMTEQFLAAQNRPQHYRPLAADPDAHYDRIIEINLSKLVPMAACPSSPDNVVPVEEIAGRKIHQVVIGSCTNSSYTDLTIAAEILKGRKIDPSVEFGIAPGSRQVLQMITRSGALADLLAAGARLLESACGPCIGQGFSPGDGTVTLRTFNRNFAGRTGTKGDQCYLVSPETAAASAIMGEITDPRSLKEMIGLRYPAVKPPKEYVIDDSMIDPPLPPEEAANAVVIRGPTIVVPESPRPLPETLTGQVLLKCGDKITTDHIMPAGAFLKYRSNVPEYSKYVFNSFNEEGKPTFAQRCLALKKQGLSGIVVAGESYGQGSSREHAALCPMYLGLRAVLAKSIERIHRANLINFAIVPIEFAAPADYDRIQSDDMLEIPDLTGAIRSANEVEIFNRTQGFSFQGRLVLSHRDREILLAAGLLNYAKKKAMPS
ncbi:MAG TPA: aconitate hydratase [Anaerohalosphaeraceae bacterium]|nr:aconitate hydratase [Anaerohalosphaeraceae bacterium]HOL90055.1 aconitate hydratase [Anaerohalosphaeraceae bacterium]HPP56826.1 aconitate hydratase [Anaerohalosphaeraceae bacterium]